MTVSMITCPSCRTLLFSDTIICPACKHVLDEELAKLINTDDNTANSRSEQVPCRNCGEANQIGLVRCWNCSSFLREDIQVAYYQMLRGHREVIYSQRTAPAPTSNLPDARPNVAERNAADDLDGDDFELSDSYQLAPSPVAKRAGNPPAPPSSPPPKTAATEPAPEPLEPAPANSTETPPRDRPRPPGPDDSKGEDHSIATGGDVLLDIALREERESESGRMRREALVQKKQQRKAGQKAAAEGEVSPERLAAQKRALAKRRAAKKAAEQKQKPPAKYGLWLSDVHQHLVNPQKMRLKPGSVEKQFTLVDVGCSAEAVMIVGLTKKPSLASLFAKSSSKPEEIRQQVREQLESDKPKAELPAPSHEALDAQTVAQFKVVQPVVYVHESMFAGVPVFGTGRIVVRVPLAAASAEQRFLSFWLTEFRQFSQALETYFQVKDLGILEGVPLTDPLLDLKCHYSDEPLKALEPESVVLYEADPQMKLELIGRRCEACGLAVSEEARRKEKIGGLNGKSIAKAKCPKCEKKFGGISLFRLAATAPKPDEPPTKRK